MRGLGGSRMECTPCEKNVLLQAYDTQTVSRIPEYIKNS